MIHSWQKRRSEFNHDWLKNRYLPAVAKWLNILDDRVEDERFQRDFPNKVLTQWEEYRLQARLLAEQFEFEMSPRIHFSRPPLSRAPGFTREWLGPLVHELWLARYPVRQWVGDTLVAVDAVDASYGSLRNAVAFKEEVSIEELRALRGGFAKFQRLCQALARAIEAFPSKPLIT